MARIDLSIPTEDGQSPATLHLPDGDGPWPAVIMYTDAGGVRETFLSMADRLAGLGYVTLLPDVYYRHGDWRPFDVHTMFSDPDERARLMSMVHSVTPEHLVADAGAYLEFLAGRPEVTGTGVGTTGYCMGGRESLLTAGHHPERVAAAASFHGGRLAAADDPDSPYLLADRIRATVYVAAAENDASCPPEQLERLEKSLAEAGVAHTVETYPAAHGFAVPDNPTYDPAAEQRHWSALERLYGAALHG
ncbi:MAG TPA: dienelactone hydrolase family protein [Pseudonocardia sp.]|nr:dienelactone hydrolase family protein [Pseudonocardia sp.]